MENGFGELLNQRRFEVVKNRLLLRWLDETPNSEAHPRLIAEANVATVLAGLTPFPLLLFPCLFEERARASLERARRDALGYWRGLGPIPSATDLGSPPRPWAAPAYADMLSRQNGPPADIVSV